jgi:uncharacterized lipoprotein YajG
VSDLEFAGSLKRDRQEDETMTKATAMLAVTAILMAAGCAARQQTIVEAPKTEIVICEPEQVEMTLFVDSPEEAERQVIETGWRPVEVRQATLSPVGVRQGVWVVSASRRVCRPSA